VAFVSRNGSVGPCCRRCPPFIWHGSIWGHNHELVAPLDHDAFVGFVTTFFSAFLWIFVLKTDLFPFEFWAYTYVFLVSFFHEIRCSKDYCQHSPL
jgi:hypothetical protein